MKHDTTFAAGCCLIFGILYMVLCPTSTVQAVSCGLTLWMNQVIPVLLPFLLCSEALISMDLAKHVQDAGIYTLLLGWFCGYPMGAKTCADFVERGIMSRQEGNRLLRCCSCPSPMFLSGFAMHLLDKKQISVVSLFVCVYLPCVLFALLPASGEESDSFKKKTFASRPTQDIYLSVSETLLKIGMTIIIFSMLGSGMMRLPHLPLHFKCILSGMLEITNGLTLFTSCPGLPHRELFCLFLLSSGGACTMVQTAHVIKSARLSIRHYVIWKLMHAIASVSLFILLKVLLPV